MKNIAFLIAFLLINTTAFPQYEIKTEKISERVEDYERNIEGVWKKIMSVRHQREIYYFTSLCGIT